MNLSDGEKLILLMLSELYDKLEVDGEIEPDFIRSAIFNDSLWGIPWKYSGIPFDDQDTPVVVRGVVDVLDMWDVIEASVEQLSDEEKEQLKKEAEPFGRDPTFKGFDGNNETEYLVAAHFLIDDLERFQRFKGRELNSHAPSIDSYSRMLTIFSEYRKSLAQNLLSVKQLAEILLEQMHPSNR